MPRQITSRDNVKIKSFCKLRDLPAFRRKENSFTAEGLKLCQDLCERIAPKEIYITKEALWFFQDADELCEECYEISPHVAEKLSLTRENQGVFCVFPMPKPAVLSKGRWVLLENVQDPGNVGTTLRSAAAFGYCGAVLSCGCADPFSPKAMRASMGATAQIPLILNAKFPEIITQLKNEGNIAYAATLTGEVTIKQAQRPNGVCLVIGNEGNGLTDETVEACDIAVSIPMSGRTESLNAATAAAVFMWHFGEDF